MTKAAQNTHSMRRIGLLGGTFDPVHLGHLAIAKAAQTQLQLDEIWFVPAGHPWQKNRLPSSAAHRLAMLHLVIHDQSTWRVEDIELTRAGPSYAVDTLTVLRSANPQATFIWLIGADQLHNLASWHEWPKLLSLCRFGVAPRSGYVNPAVKTETTPNSLVSVALATDGLAAFEATAHNLVEIPTSILRWLNANQLEPQSYFQRLHMMPLSCASSAIRANLMNGALNDVCLSPAVLHYLLTHSLYR